MQQQPYQQQVSPRSPHQQKSPLGGNTMNSARSPNMRKSPGYNTSILDREERDLINLANNLSKEEIWEKLEQKRFTQLKQAAVNLQSEMLFSNRCPKCTLLPPCKHYQTPEQIIQEVPHIMQQPSFKQHLSPKRREYLYKALKDQQKMALNNTQPEFGSKSVLDEGSMMHGFSYQEANQSMHEIMDVLPVEQNTFGVGQVMITSQDNQVQKVTQKMGFLGNRSNRNSIMNNTVAVPMGFRGISEHQQSGANLHPSKLSHYGANILGANQTMRGGRKHYLRKRQGNGGSPVPEMSQQHNESRISEESLVRGGGQRRDRTTVRIRTKNNQYMYGEASFTQPLNSTKNDIVKNHAYFDTSQQSMQERERVQAMIAKYREEKIQRQIERIEEEKLKIEMERQQQKDDEMRRRKYNDQLKHKLQQYQEVRYNEQSEKDREDRVIVEREQMKQRMKKQYYESQRKYITDYREQKKRTDELLLIPNPQPQRSVFYNQFPQQPQQRQANYHSQHAPLASVGVISNAGAQFIKSGQGQVEPAHKQRQQYTQEEEEEEHYEPYYDEDEHQESRQQVAKGEPYQIQQKKSSKVESSQEQTQRQEHVDSLDLVGKQ